MSSQPLFKYVLNPLFSNKLLKAKKDFLESRVVTRNPEDVAKPFLLAAVFLGAVANVISLRQ